MVISTFDGTFSEIINVINAANQNVISTLTPKTLKIITQHIQRVYIFTVQ